MPMSCGMREGGIFVQIFRAAVLIAWLVVMWVKHSRRSDIGIQSGRCDVLRGLQRSRRAQSNADFSAHLLLMAAWIVYRQKYLLPGLLFGLAAVMFGGAFSLAYIFVATFTAKSSFKGLLLGYRATEPAP